MTKKLFSILFLSLTFFNQIFTSYSFEKDILEVWLKMNCKIIWIDDWDTFNLSCLNQYNQVVYINNVRLLWLNTPDLGGYWYKHCYYDESKDVVNFLKISKRDLEVSFYGSDLCKDPFKWCRNLVTIKDLETWEDINSRMILNWYAFKWISFSNIPKDIKINYTISELKAKKEKSWLWWRCEIVYNKTEIDTSIPPAMTK